MLLMRPKTAAPEAARPASDVPPLPGSLSAVPGVPVVPSAPVVAPPAHEASAAQLAPWDPAKAEKMRGLRASLVEQVAGRLSDAEAIRSGLKVDDATTERVRQVAAEAYRLAAPGLDAETEAELLNQVVDEFCGFGPIQPLLDDPAVSEIMVNGPRHVYAERKGKSVRTPIRFDDDAHVRRVIDRIILPLGRRLDSKCPLVDARLPDGSRVNAVIPPVAIDGPSLTIRKFGKGSLTPDDLVRFGTLTAGNGRVPQGVRRRPAEHHRLRRHRQRQDHAAERPLQLHPRRRAHRHHRRRGRAEAGTGARRAPGEPAARPQRQGRGHASASWCATPCGCGRSGSWSASAAAAKRWTCSRR